MTRDYLKSLGIAEEIIDKIMAAHGQSMGDLTQQVSSLTADRDSLKEQNETNAEALKGLKEDAEKVPGLKSKIEEMESSAEKATAANEEKQAEMKKGYEIQIALQNAGAKNLKAVAALLDNSLINLDKDGNIVGLSEQLEKLTTSEDSSFLFQQKDEEGGSEEQRKKKITFGANSTGSNTPPGEVDPFAEAMKEFE